MRLRDNTTRNLEIIRYARNRSGRVPVEMQIMVKPEVPGNDDTPSQTEWATAIATIEEKLTNCIEKHLALLINQLTKEFVRE